MANLMTIGLTDSLLTAFNRAKLAEKPMIQVSNEFKKLNPDTGKIQRGLEYGADELTKAIDAKNKATEELEIAAQIAREEEKIEAEQRLAEKATKPSEASRPVGETGEITNDKVSDSGVSISQAIEKNIEDKIELSPEALKIIAENSAPKVVTDAPKVYTKTASVKSAPKLVAKESKLDISA